MGNAAEKEIHSKGAQEASSKIVRLLVEDLGCSHAEAISYVENHGADEYKIIVQVAEDVLPKHRVEKWRVMFKSKRYLEETKTLIRNYRMKDMQQALNKESMEKPPPFVDRPMHNAQMLELLSSCKISPWNLTLVRSVAKLKQKAEQIRQNQQDRQGQSQVSSLHCKRRSAEEVNLLQARLANFGLAELVMAGDGNCQFRSISYELFGSAERHAFVRTRTVSYMREHSQAFLVFFASPMELEQYLDKMDRLGTWGDELTLKAAAEAFRATVHVLTSTKGFGGFYLEYVPDSATVDKTVRLSHPAARHVFLTYLSPLHYNVMTLRRDSERLRLSTDARKLLNQCLST